MNYEILSPELFETIEGQDRQRQAEWLFLEPSTSFRGGWEIWGLWPEWFLEFEPIVGKYRNVTPASLEEVTSAANEFGYRICFVEDPFAILKDYESLRDVPPVALNSDLENTTNGFLPWQTVGYNKLIKDESLTAGYVVWDTGAGKTAFIAAAIRHHQEVGHPFNLALVAVKSHNKVETQRKLLRLAGIESIVIDGTIEKRYDIYEQIQTDLIEGKQVVAITNYEKFREDHAVFKYLLKKRDCLFFWDEMPAKLSNRKTQLYKAVKQSLYESFYSKPRASWMRHFVLTATPIENSPNDVFSCINLCWPGLLGNVTEFTSNYAVLNQTYRKVAWKNLDRLEAELGFIMHRVSKNDPEVAAMFPKVIPLPQAIDWDPKHRMVYDKLTGKALDLLDEIEDANILSLIQIMQMLCDAPSMIKQSAANRDEFRRVLQEAGEDATDMPYNNPRGSEIAVLLAETVSPKYLTDVGHAKLDMWREIICDKHPDAKIVTFSTWSGYILPVWEYWLKKWGVSYEIYTGTDKQRQAALDRFRNDPSIRVFLSGDAGSDSIDISEASVCIDYNIPWKWTRLQQRQGRLDRVNSSFDTLYTYSLLMVDSIDERKLEVCERKHGYHDAVFEGRAVEESVSASFTREDLIYVLSGSRASSDVQ